MSKQDSWKTRTELLLGAEGLERLAQSHVLVAGVGGVGAYAAEQLCRAGVGELTIVDADTVSVSNINRQLPALHSTVGQSKVELMARRLLDINPALKLHCLQEFLRDERTAEVLDSAPYDCVLDAIDTLSPKVYLLYEAHRRGLPVISAMGAGGKRDPGQIQIADIAKSHHCALAKMVRKRLYRLGVRHGITVVFSPEPVPNEAVIIDDEPTANKLSTVGTISYMPAAFGCFAAAATIDILQRGTAEQQ